MDFSLDEYLSISRELEKHSMLFNRLWEAGRPVFSDDVPSSAVRLNKENDVLEFALNEKFWNSLDDYSKKFVISHECAHIALKHGTRGAALPDYTPESKNVAMDISINHLLCKYFGFERDKISCEESLCWIDTVFPPDQKVLDDKAFEYYLEQMKKLPTGEGGISLFAGDGSPLDDPSALSDDIDKWVQEQIDNGSMGATQEDIEDLNNKMQGAGSESTLTTWITVKKTVQPKKKWITIVKKWNKKSFSEEDAEQWTKINRRYNSLSSDFFIPTDNSNEDFNKSKIKLYLFLDVSGSCANAREQFLIAAKSIPSKFFDIKTFVFDTHTRELDIKKGGIWAGGGTNFQCIEDTLRQLKEYPEIVWVFSDGDAWQFSCQHPERWSWFLLPRGKKDSIPKKSKIYQLSAFE